MAMLDRWFSFFFFEITMLAMLVQLESTLGEGLGIGW
jgi:hypothetical protein